MENIAGEKNKIQNQKHDTNAKNTTGKTNNNTKSKTSVKNIINKNAGAKLQILPQNTKSIIDQKTAKRKKKHDSNPEHFNSITNKKTSL